MSAYIVDPAHIDVLLSVAIHGPRGTVRPWRAPNIDELLRGTGRAGFLMEPDADLAGRELLRRCIASVSYRYREVAGGLPGPFPTPDPEQYEWTDFGLMLTPIEALAALEGYEDQSSEDPDWWDSGAHWFCHRFRSGLIRRIRGYAAAEHHWTTEKALAIGPRRVSGRRAR